LFLSLSLHGSNSKETGPACYDLDTHFPSNPRFKGNEHFQAELVPLAAHYDAHFFRDGREIGTVSRSSHIVTGGFKYLAAGFLRPFILEKS
jgi:hypothetical protein